ncbi:transporter, partial [Bacillus cereus]
MTGGNILNKDFFPTCILIFIAIIPSSIGVFPISSQF